jgi:high-affinity nickel-transport protein
LVGVLHGLAGSAATTLLAFSSLQDERQAVLYLGLFGLGTIVGMLLVTLLLALSFRWLGSRGRRIPGWISRGSGVASICAGIWMAIADEAHHL